MEKFIPTYFKGWLEIAREAEKEYWKQKRSKDEPGSFKGFEKTDEGGVDPDEWDQWCEFVADLLKGEEVD